MEEADAPVTTTDLSGMLRDAEGDGVQWALAAPGELNVNLVHLEAGHGIGEHVNDAVDVVVVVLAGAGRLTVDGRTSSLTPHVVAQVPRGARRRLQAAAEQGLDYLSIHRRRGALAIGSARPPEAVEAVDAGTTAADEGGDPACWAHLVEEADTGEPG